MFDLLYRGSQFVEDKRPLTFTDIWYRFDSLHRFEEFYVSLDYSRRIDRVDGQDRSVWPVFLERTGRA